MAKNYLFSKVYVYICSILLSFSFIFPTMSFAANRELVEKIGAFKNSPEAHSLNSNQDLAFIDFYPSELENQNVVFPKVKVCKLSLDIQGYLANNAFIFGQGYGYIISSLNFLINIAKDLPELAEQANDHKQKMLALYGPAVLQFLCFLNDVDEYQPLLPNNFLKNIKPELEKASIENPIAKERMPFIFGNKYKKEYALELLKESEICVSDENMNGNLCFLLSFHPMALTCNSDFILSNLCWSKELDFESGGKKIPWRFKAPKYWDLIRLDENKDDPFTLFGFSCGLDNILAFYRNFDIPDDIKSKTPKNTLELLKEKEDYLKTILGDSNVVIKNKTLSKLGKADVLIIDYKSPSLSGNSNLKRICRSYIFLVGKSIFAYNYSVAAVSENACNETMERNIPLFDSLVKATKLSYSPK